MKTSIAIPAVLLLSTLAALAQGTVNFSTRVTGTVVEHVYYLNPALTLVTGSGFYAQLWAANGPDQLESALLPVPNALTTFRTGATLGGTPAPLVVAVPGILPGATGTFQIRVWNNQGGTINSWESGGSSSAPFGRSALFNVSNLGDGILTLPADMANFRSFTLTPEPSSYLLLGLGGVGVWLARRRKLSV